MGTDGVWWSPRSSKPSRPDYVGLGGFDSHTLSPRRLALRPPQRSRTFTRMIARAALLLAFVSAALGAQALRGRVTMPDSVAPAVGILVAASDARGAEIARAVSNERGEFLLPLPRSGRFDVRALRVGYRPTFVSSVDVAAGDTVAVRIVLARDLVRLATIVVRRSDDCRARDQGGARVAEVWEEARKALLAAQIPRGGDALVVEWIRYDRQIDSTGRRVLDQVVRLSRSPSDQPFRSRDAALLARDGYVVEDSIGVNYYAPDAEVLLSESFAGTHCFQLAEAPTGEPGLIGLAFRPVAAALRRRDIIGTFWIDRASAELRAIDFVFTGLPAAAERADPGGRVEFTPLPDGVWLVSRWQIRMPELERVMPSTVGGRRVRVVGSSIRLRGAKVVGGEITRVERGGSVVFRARGSALAVRLLAPDGHAAALAGTTVRLDGTDYVAQADSAGIALFPLVLPGRYRVAVTPPAADADPVRPVRVEADVGGDSLRTVQVRLPTRGPRFDAAGLGLVPAPRPRAEVEFTVTDTLARALGGAEIIATDAARTVHRLRSDSLGKARLTDLPLGELHVEARLPGYHLAIGVVDVALGRTPAQVLLERIQGTVLDEVRIEAAGDETPRYRAFESRRRAGVATASITREEIEKRGVVNAWQILLNVSAIELIEGPEGVVPVSRRVRSMDLRGNQPCYMRLAIDGVLLPESPVNLSQRLPSVPEIHGIEVFGGPASIPSEYAGDQRDLVCGLIVVWTR